MKLRTSLAGLVLLASCSVACSEADQHALNGKDALDDCDLRTANEEFAAAYAGEPDNGEYALAFVFTDLAVLVEDPAVQALAPRFGFESDIDSAFLWGKDGMLQKLSNKSNACEDITELLPHPSAQDDGPDFEETIDESLTFSDVRTQLLALAPRLQKLAAASHTAAQWVDDKDEDERFVRLEGSCGIGQLDVQAPELFALAAGLEAAVAATEAARAYDGDIPVRLFFDQTTDNAQEWVDTMNDHLGHLTGTAGLDAARQHLVTSMQYAGEALAAAKRVGAPDSAVFDWKKLPAGFVGDVQPFVEAAESALSSDRAVAVPTITPALEVNAYSFFARPVDTSSMTPQLWSVQVDDAESPPYSYVDEDFTALETELATRMSPDPFADDAEFESSLGDKWENYDENTFEAVFDPGGRFSDGYDCR